MNENENNVQMMKKRMRKKVKSYQNTGDQH